MNALRSDINEIMFIYEKYKPRIIGAFLLQQINVKVLNK